MLVSRRLFNRNFLQIGRAFKTQGPNKAPRSGVRFTLIGASVGAIVGTGYSIHQLNKPSAHITNKVRTIEPLEKPPPIHLSREVKYSDDNSGLSLILYQYQSCPFCCKVRAFLDYYGVSYGVVEVHPITRDAIKWSPYKKVPILLAQTDEGYQPLNDSSMIISAISTYLKERQKQKFNNIVSYYPFISFDDEDGKTKYDIMNKYFVMNQKEATKEADSEERKWRQWTDDVFVHTLSPNVYRTIPEAIEAFTWFSTSGDWEKYYSTVNRYFIIYAGAFAMWMVGKRIQKKHCLKPNVRDSLFDECNRWMKAVKERGKFHGGDRPNLADLSVYGVLSSIEGCQAFQDALKQTKIGDWYFATQQAIKTQAGNKFY